MITKLWYSVQNAGDGSVHLEFMECKELAQLDQEFMEEGWGETCIGCIEIEHNGSIKIRNHITTIDLVIEEAEEELRQTWIGPEERKKLEQKLQKLKELKE